MALNKDERQVCLQIAVRGEVILREKGWDSEQRKNFLRRKDVQRELQRIEEEFRDREGFIERAKFTGLIELSKMMPVAIATYQQALLTGKKDGNGNVIEAPNAVALNVAMDLMDRFDVKGGKFSEHDALPVLVQNNTQINVGSEEGSPEATIARERLRTRLEQMMQGLEVEGNFIEGAEVVDTRPKRRRRSRRVTDVEAES